LTLTGRNDEGVTLANAAGGSSLIGPMAASLPAAMQAQDRDVMHGGFKQCVVWNAMHRWQGWTAAHMVGTVCVRKSASQLPPMPPSNQEQGPVWYASTGAGDLQSAVRSEAEYPSVARTTPSKSLRLSP
jgi:hypothetical protein